MTLEKIINALVEHYGWGELGIHVKIRCFNHDPSVKSSLKFLRKNPWARDKVEALYLDMLKERPADPAHHSPSYESIQLCKVTYMIKDNRICMAKHG